MNQQGMYTTPKQIVLRTPSYSLQDVDKLETKLQNDGLLLFKIGILISSKDLYYEWQKNPNNSKLFLSLYKYWLRTCTRPTPFATFSGCSTIDLSTDKSKIILDSTYENSIKIRLTLDTIEKLINRIQSDCSENFLEQSKLVLNDSFYSSKNNFRYFKLMMLSNSKKDYYLTSIKRDKYINYIVNLTTKGTFSLNELSFFFIEKFTEISLEEAKDYIKELINAQILAHSCNISLTGEDLMKQLLNLIQDNKINIKKDLEQDLSKLNELYRKPKYNMEFFEKINENISKLTNSSDIGFIAEVFPKQSQGNINSETLEIVLKQVEELQHFFYLDQNYNLNTFKNSFHTRYGDQKIPLLEALDPNRGLGYAGMVDQNNGISKYSGMLESILNDEIKTSTNETGTLSNFTLKKFIEFERNNNKIIEITEDDLHLRTKAISDKSLFPNFSVIIGSLLHEDNKSFTFNLLGMGGVSGGTNILGRFAYGDEKLRLLLNELTSHEESSNPDCLFAEIVHYPNTKVGNISQRPPLRKYEIPFIAKSSVEKKNRISLQDLLISVVDNKIILESKTIKKQVIPRLSSAHNFRLNTIPVYQFLGDLQLQNIPISDFWNWGMLQNEPYLPRVIYKNLILSRATWTLDLLEIKKNLILKDDFLYLLSETKEKLNIPDKVLLVNGDNELYIDFNIIQCQTILIDYLKKQKRIVLKEFLFTDKNSLVHDIHGKPYTHELIIPIYKKQPDVIKTSLNSKKNLYKKYKISSQWLFLKIYGGRETLEELLSTSIYKFLKKNNHLFEKFFYIRYNDETGFHIRLRFQNIEGYFEKNSQIIQLITDILENGESYRVLVDEYSPELNRYGGKILITQAEDLFNFDSLATLKFLNHLNILSEPDDYRMWFAIRSTEKYLDDFQSIIKDKYEFITLIRDNFFREFNVPKKSYNRLNKINSLMKIHEITNINTRIDKILNIRSKQIKNIVTDINNKTNKYDNISLYNLVGSYIHMSVNRIFPTKQRENELIIYNYLERKIYSTNNRIKSITLHTKPI